MDKVTQKEYTIVRQNDRKKALKLEELAQQRDRPYYERKDDW